MIQAQTQTADYWGKRFSLTDSDIEQLYNHLLETEKPQSISELARVLFQHRVNEEIRAIQRTMKGRAVYQPQNEYEVGADLVFPALGFVQGTVTAVRAGFNPEEGSFSVVAVDLAGKQREFATAYTAPHPLNSESEGDLIGLLNLDTDALLEQFGPEVMPMLAEALRAHPDFVVLGSEWFVKSLMADINVGHLHLAEAVLEIADGGPMTADEILPNLDLDPGVDRSVQRFSLNYALLKDGRFDEVGGKGRVTWSLRRMEPEAVQTIPPRLVYEPIEYDRTLLTSQLRLLEHELDDEWSQFDTPAASQPAILALTYPHRLAGTLPLSSRLRPLFDTGKAPRQRVVFVEEETQQEIVGWVVPEGRYVYGLGDWYAEHEIPVGGFINLAPGAEPGRLILGYDSRKPQREWVRLATVVDNRIHFELKRRAVGCGYDDLLIVGTDVVAAIDALWRRNEAGNRSLVSIMAEMFPSLAVLTPQNTVHAKTLYSAVNMVRRTPPGPIFAELERHPAFQTVGDHYWVFDAARWKDGS